MLQFDRLWFQDGRLCACWNDDSHKLLRAARDHLYCELKGVLSRRCTHLKGHGGVKRTLSTLAKKNKEYRFVARFDVKSYYESIDHTILLGLLKNAGVSDELRHIVLQYLAIPDRKGSGRGMIAGGHLSPLLAALYLAPLDQAMGSMVSMRRVFYIRYMDDFVILAKTRPAFRKAIRVVHDKMRALKLTLHPNKRFIGKVYFGFDFLGYRVHPNRKLRPSAESLQQLACRFRRLYEQGADAKRLWQYTTRWCCWLWGGLKGWVSRRGGVRRYFFRTLVYLGIRGMEAPAESSLYPLLYKA